MLHNPLVFPYKLLCFQGLHFLIDVIEFSCLLLESIVMFSVYNN
jgi:hypothetical protein